jgi:hypothetical protein
MISKLKGVPKLLPPPLRGRVGEGGKSRTQRVRFTPLPTDFWSVDLPRKGGGVMLVLWSDVA